MSNDWINRESEILELEQKEFNENSGNVSYWKIPQGATDITVDTTTPVKDSNFPDKKELHIFVNDEEKIWTISRKSPMYREVIHALKEGKTKFKVIRIGSTASDTRYDLVVA